MTFDRFDIVVVPFPFTDRNVRLRRPAVILSGADFGSATGQSLLAMITRAERSAWPGDMPISDLAAAGLSGPCVIRLKLFTLVNVLISRKLGSLAEGDRQRLSQRLSAHLGLASFRNPPDETAFVSPP